MSKCTFEKISIILFVRTFYKKIRGEFLSNTKPATIIKKSNILISGKYNSSILENKLLTLGLLKAEEEDGRIISRITTKELKEYLCGGGKKINGSFYTQIKIAADEMIDRKIFIEDRENNRFVIMGLIGVVRYENNILEIKFEPDMTEYILNVKSNYTNLSIPILMSFKKNYSYRLYEMLKSGLYDKNRNWDNLDKEEFRIDFDLAELKMSLGVVDMSERDVKHELRRGKLDLETIVSDVSKNKKFDSWSNFKFCVIDPAINEINEKSDIHLHYSLNRTGNGGRVSGISFYICKKTALLPDEVITKTCLPSSDTIESMIDDVLDYINEPITRENAKSFLKVAKWDVQKVYDVYEMANKQENIDNFVGWMISVLSTYAPSNNIHKVSGYTYEETKEWDEMIARTFKHKN